MSEDVLLSRGSEGLDRERRESEGVLGDHAPGHIPSLNVIASVLAARGKFPPQKGQLALCDPLYARLLAFLEEAQRAQV
jgi:hypothetical protein